MPTIQSSSKLKPIQPKPQSTTVQTVVYTSVTVQSE